MTLKIGHGHELVIVARHQQKEPLYFTASRCWTHDPAKARLFNRASDAHKNAASLRLSDRSIAAEGIACEEFGHS